ncbi:MAG: ATP-binding protein [Comamonadaceae bacterium]|nr:MAG: ATP-binding protein [Comamonadaceae bacterium]
MKSLLIPSVLALAVLAGCATQTAPDAPTRTVDGVLIGPSGHTLYTFGRDAAGTGKSLCNDTCATNWPPLIAPGAARPMGGYTVIQRDDGRAQWAYKGAPLYYWTKDGKPGDRTGDGVGGLWKIARP